MRERNVLPVRLVRIPLIYYHRNRTIAYRLTLTEEG